MMRATMFGGLLALALGTPLAAAQAPVAGPVGTWLNPHSSVAVKTGACGDRMCGRVVWASRQAQDDARDGGVAPLVGTELLENYRPEGRGAWAGTVFVPDMGRRFSSEISQVGPDRLKVKGCILGGLICKSQVWTRIEHLPNA